MAHVIAATNGLLWDDIDLWPSDERLRRRHYLGVSTRATVRYRDEFGLLVLANPSSRHLPHGRWLELVRWCLIGAVNGGSQQWVRARKWRRTEYPHITTVMSYSDPSVGHTGARYRACNWLWAPTWQRLRPPPSQGGSWDGVQQQATKDRWVAVLAPDSERASLLAIHDGALVRRMPWAEYREPIFRGSRVVGGGGDWKRWTAMAEPSIVRAIDPHLNAV